MQNARNTQKASRYALAVLRLTQNAQNTQKSTRCACAASVMRIFFETEEHKNRLYLWTYVTFVFMSKKQVATLVLPSG